MQCPNFNALSVISFAAAVMSLTYSTIAIGGSISVGQQTHKSEFATSIWFKSSFALLCRTSCAYLEYACWAGQRAHTSCFHKLKVQVKSGRRFIIGDPDYSQLGLNSMTTGVEGCGVSPAGFGFRV